MIEGDVLHGSRHDLIRDLLHERERKSCIVDIIIVGIIPYVDRGNNARFKE